MKRAKFVEYMLDILLLTSPMMLGTVLAVIITSYASASELATLVGVSLLAATMASFCALLNFKRLKPMFLMKDNATSRRFAESGQATCYLSIVAAPIFLLPIGCFLIGGQTTPEISRGLSILLGAVLYGLLGDFVARRIRGKIENSGMIPWYRKKDK